MDLIKFLSLSTDELKALAVKLIGACDSALLQAVQADQLGVSQLFYAQSPNINFSNASNQFSLVFVNQLQFNPNASNFQFNLYTSLQWTSTRVANPLIITPFVLICDTAVDNAVLDCEAMYYYYNFTF